MFKHYVIILFVSILFLSCSDSSTNSNLKTDISGDWVVTRTLISGSSSFPQGYQDVQNWKFTTNGNSATLTTTAGSINGSWKTSSNFANEHWVFEAQGNDPLTSLPIKIIVEIIAVNKLKGTNETYYYDSMNQMWLLLDAFSIEGVKK